MTSLKGLCQDILDSSNTPLIRSRLVAVHALCNPTGSSLTINDFFEKEGKPYSKVIICGNAQRIKEDMERISSSKQRQFMYYITAMAIGGLFIGGMVVGASMVTAVTQALMLIIPASSGTSMWMAGLLTVFWDTVRSQALTAGAYLGGNMQQKAAEKYKLLQSWNDPTHAYDMKNYTFNDFRNWVENNSTQSGERVDMSGILFLVYNVLDRIMPNLETQLDRWTEHLTQEYDKIIAAKSGVSAPKNKKCQIQTLPELRAQLLAKDPSMNYRVLMRPDGTLHESTEAVCKALSLFGGAKSRPVGSSKKSGTRLP